MCPLYSTVRRPPPIMSPRPQLGPFRAIIHFLPAMPTPSERSLICNALPDACWYIQSQPENINKYLLIASSPQTPSIHPGAWVKVL